MGVRWLLAVEVAVVCGFIVLFGRGSTDVAWALLVIPAQVALWVALANDTLELLRFVVLLTPLAAIDLLPHVYHRVVVFPITLTLLILFNLTPFVDGTGGGRRLRPDWFVSLAFLLGCWIAASYAHAVASGWGSSHLHKCNVLALQSFALGYFCAVLPRDAADVGKVAGSAAVGGVIATVVLPIVAGHGASYGFLGGKRVEGAFGLVDLNALGFVLACCAAVLLALMVTSRTRMRLVQAGAFALLMFALIYTRSRGAWLGFGIASMYTLVRVRSVRLAMVGGAAGIVVAVSDILRSALSSRIEATSVTDPSLVGRVALWNVAWRAAKSNWLFGLGWENFRLLKPRYGFPTSVFHWTDYNAHSVYMEALADLGFVGFAAFLALLIGAFWNTDRIARDRSAPSWSPAVAVNAAIIVFVVHGVVDCLSDTFTFAAVWFGLAVGLSQVHARTAGDGASPAAYAETSPAATR
jgi:O-antigen ligase